MRKFILMTGTAFLAVTALAGCGAESGNSAGGNNDCQPAHSGLSTVSDGTLTVAAPHFPPFTKVNGTKLSGVEGKILQEIAAMECLTLTVKPLDHASAISAAKNGRVDLAAGNWYCTAKRTEVMSLAGPIYMDQAGIVSTTGASAFSELEGKPVGTVSGYHWNEDLEEIYGQHLKIYPDATAMYNDLSAGRIEAGIDSFGSATYANKQNGNEWMVEVASPDERVPASVKPAQVCFPTSKQNDALVTAVNEDLENLRNDGTTADILEQNGLDRSAAKVGELDLVG